MSNSIRFPFTTTAVLTIALLAACGKERDADTAPQAEVPAEAASPPAAPIVLKDVIENDARYIIGISYPPQAAKYPGLAQALHGYAEQARADLLKEVGSIDAAKQNGPYDLTLNFSLLAETPDVVAVAADGSSFTGGAHGTPLVARFVWLPQQNRLLASDGLFSDPRSWAAISDYTRDGACRSDAFGWQDDRCRDRACGRVVRRVRAGARTAGRQADGAALRVSAVSGRAVCRRCAYGRSAYNGVVPASRIGISRHVRDREAGGGGRSGADIARNSGIADAISWSARCGCGSSSGSGDCRGEHFAAIAFQFQIGQRIRAGMPTVEDRDRQAAFVSRPDETESRIHHQR